MSYSEIPQDKDVSQFTPADLEASDIDEQLTETPFGLTDEQKAELEEALKKLQQNRDH